MVMEKNNCVLYDRKCINCGECNMCDLDNTKICNNCCKCIDIDSDYISVNIDEIIEGEEEELEELDLNQWKYTKSYTIYYEKE